MSILPIVLAMMLGGQVNGPGSKRQLVQVDVPESVEAHAGKPFEVPVKFYVQDGYHINSNKPSEDYLLGTRIEWEASTAKHVDDTFPPADMKVFSFTKGKKLAVFEGVRVVKAHFTAPSSKGSVTLEGVFKYQACDQHACYPPSKVPVKVSVKVVE